MVLSPKLGVLLRDLPASVTEVTFVRKLDKQRKVEMCFYVTIRQLFYFKLKSTLAPRPGFEPGTYGLTVRRSTD